MNLCFPIIHPSIVKNSSNSKTLRRQHDQPFDVCFVRKNYLKLLLFTCKNTLDISWKTGCPG
jgi:hypothetical protein